MKKKFTIVVGFFLVVFATTYLSLPFFSQSEDDSNVITSEITPTQDPPKVLIKNAPVSYQLSSSLFVGQTFNNCGPASLSMVLSMLGTNISQADLASSMRPFNNPLGGVDDKSIFAHEFVSEAERQGFSALHRPSGTIELLKQFVSNDIPVVVRTWLNQTEDIGHFRVVTGYNSATQTLTYQDSYYGPNQTQSEEEFKTLWQPFNYGYILVYPTDKKEVVEAIIGENIDEKVAWENAKKRAETELANNPNDAFSRFNLATAEYYLGNYDMTIEAYEDALSGLPGRMLWYQPEPIYAYQKEKKYDEAIRLIDSILFNGNLAYSELYQIKGEIYIEQGNVNAAREMFERAIYYNSSFQPAKESLQSLT